MSSEKIANLQSNNFDNEVLNSTTPVLVDFWAPWCGPCRAVGPVLEELAEELGDKVKISKVNVDEVGDIAGRYRIMSIPTLVVFSKGEVADKIVGARSKSELKEFLKKYIE